MQTNVPFLSDCIKGTASAKPVPCPQSAKHERPTPSTSAKMLTKQNPALLGRDASQDSQEAHGHAQEGTRLQPPRATPVPDPWLQGPSAAGQQAARSPRQPGRTQAPHPTHPRHCFTSAEGSRAHCGATSEPQDVTATLSPHTDQEAGQETSLHPIPGHVSKQNQPNCHLPSTAKKKLKKFTIRYLSPLLQPWQM